MAGSALDTVSADEPAAISPTGGSRRQQWRRRFAGYHDTC